MTQIARDNSQFGSVFKPASAGGPRFNPAISPFGQPSWEDRRNPGNTKSVETAEKIMSRWDNQKMARFDYFMEQFFKDKTPWRQEFLDRTAPGWDQQKIDIIKCKTELIKRLLEIKICGPESLEDWCLLFLYYDNELDIPQNIEELIKPATSYVKTIDWINPPATTTTKNPNMFVHPPDLSIQYPSNMRLPGLTDKPLPRYTPTLAIPADRKSEKNPHTATSWTPVWQPPPDGLSYPENTRWFPRGTRLNRNQSSLMNLKN